MTRTTPGERGGRWIRIRAWGRGEHADERTGRKRDSARVRSDARVDWVSETIHDMQTRERGSHSRQHDARNEDHSLGGSDGLSFIR
jgi:hypothetical protein